MSSKELKPQIWGSAFWYILHLTSFNFPEKPTPQDKQKMKNFIISVQRILPCNVCRENFRKDLQNLDKSLESRDTLTKLFVDVHNEINVDRGKPKYTYEAAKLMYATLIRKDSDYRISISCSKASVDRLKKGHEK